MGDDTFSATGLPRRAVLSAMIIGLCALPARAQERAQALSGAGSTFVQPLIDRWGRAFAAANEGEGGVAVSGYATLDYEPVGSAGGVVRLLQGAVDFAATDVAMAPEELDRHGLAQFPIVSGGVAVAANLALPTGTTPRLTGDVLARIGMGAVTRWSDPAIAALNPGVALPDAPIAVLHRADGSGTTHNYSAFLARRNAAWRSAIGVGWTLAWPVGRAVRGTRGMVEALRATPGAIAYLEAGEAARSGMRVVAIDNAAGRFVIPDADALAAGLAGLPWAAAAHFHQSAAEPMAAEAYPVLATVFAVLRRRPASAAGGRAALAFFRVGLSERAEDAQALGFVPLAPALVAQVVAYWPTAIRGAR
jgi:phosphate transport system substrate-binding protein